MKIRIGTRKSKLALIQTNIVIKQIVKKVPHIKYEIIPIETTGDKITDRNLYDIGGKALFLKELEEKLLSKEIDLAVHSLKDVPGVIPKELEIMAVLERHDPRDCFISFNYKSIDELPQNSVIGSSSVRRKVIINKIRPDIKIEQFRGNINTRLKKLREGQVDATILACAGLLRSKLFDPKFCYPISTNQMLPAAGQGIIAIEARSDNLKAREICQLVNDLPTWYISEAERSFMTYLDASCRTPMSAYAHYEDNRIAVKYMLSDLAGNNIHYIVKNCKKEDVTKIGITAAKKLKSLVNG